MPGKHRDGYQAAYYRARKEATQRLIDAHPDEWERYKNEAWQTAWDEEAG